MKKQKNGNQIFGLILLIAGFFLAPVGIGIILIIMGIKIMGSK